MSCDLDTHGECSCIASSVPCKVQAPIDLGTYRGTNHPGPLDGYPETARDTAFAFVGIVSLIHDIRHDAASKIVRETGNLKVGQKLLNHSSISVTAKYAHVLDTEVADAMERVAKTRENRKGGMKGNGK